MIRGIVDCVEHSTETKEQGVYMAETDQETWQANSTVVLKKTDPRGNVIDLIVNKGKKFVISPIDRQINEDMSADESLNMFSNGILTPVRLIEGSDTEKIMAENPNVMTETEMRTLFSAHPKTFAKKVSEVSSPFILARMRELADEIDATVRQVAIIEARHEQVEPKGYREVSTVGQTLGGGIENA
jgi:hypothetical protein